jgi:hypothetical protein
MKKLLFKLNFGLELIGINCFKILSFFRGLPFFIKDYFILKSQLKNNKDFVLGRFFPILFDKYDKSGIMNGHYFHQDLLVSSRIFFNNPIRHIDVGSRIDGFVAHVASFRKIEIFDIRPLESKIRNITFTQADLTKMPHNLIECCDSISSLHAIEHFGLGRYGDAIDVDGHKKAIENIYLMLKKGGKFYFSTPIGSQRIEFNAHRVFSVNYLIEIFKDKFIVDCFHYVDDAGDLFEDVILSKEQVDANFYCNYGCGIFELIKR